jgi:hypothetical protein
MPPLGPIEVGAVDMVPMGTEVGEALRQRIDAAFGYGVGTRMRVAGRGASISVILTTTPRQSADPLGGGFQAVQANPDNLQLGAEIGKIVNEAVAHYGADAVIAALSR